MAVPLACQELQHQAAAVVHQEGECSHQGRRTATHATHTDACSPVLPSCRQPSPCADVGAHAAALQALLHFEPADGAPRIVCDTGLRSTLSSAGFWKLLDSHLSENLVQLRSKCELLHPIQQGL